MCFVIPHVLSWLLTLNALLSWNKTPRSSGSPCHIRSFSSAVKRITNDRRCGNIPLHWHLTCIVHFKTQSSLWHKTLVTFRMCNVKVYWISTRNAVKLFLKLYINIKTLVSFLCSSQTSAASGHSDCPTVVSVDFNQSWSGIHSSVGTGISTERSSVFSWGYDVSLLLKENSFCLLRPSNSFSRAKFLPVH